MLSTLKPIAATEFLTFDETGGKLARRDTVARIGYGVERRRRRMVVIGGGIDDEFLNQEECDEQKYTNRVFKS